MIINQVIYDDGVIKLIGNYDVEEVYEESPCGGTPDSIGWVGEWINVHCYRVTGFVYEPETGVKVSGTIKPINFAIVRNTDGDWLSDNDKDDAKLTEAVLAKIGAFFNYAEFDMPVIQLSAGVQ